MAIIDVVSDVICPWCFIGKRRLEKALALLGKQQTEVRWKPFQLNPNAPKEGMDRKQYRIRKFGSAATSQQLEERVAAAVAAEGIHFRFDDISRTPNTFDAHRLIWLAGETGQQDTLVEKLFQAYFLEGKDIGSPQVLSEVAGSIGLGAAEILNGDEGGEAVAMEEENARRRGVNGVPSFFVDGSPLTSGAHPPELLAQMLSPIL
ncbi:MAG: DsbA family oxidoreductase [Bryobacteraceae bacterium]